MLLTFYLLFIGLHVSEGAHLIIKLTLKEGPTTTAPPTAMVNIHTSPTTSTTQSSQTPEGCPKSLPFVPFAVMIVIFLHIIVAVVYLTRTKDSPRAHYSTADGDGVVSLE
ncbi:hypothetical protein SRHO_G00074440 [Serrasalmus rhombeus]